MIDDPRVTLAYDALDHIKGDPGMDGRTLLRGYVTMEQWVALNECIEIARGAEPADGMYVEIDDTPEKPGQLTDEQAVNLLVDFVRTPEWSVSMMEDIAVIVRKARPDIGADYDADDLRAWERH